MKNKNVCIASTSDTGQGLRPARGTLSPGGPDVNPKETKPADPEKIRPIFLLPSETQKREPISCGKMEIFKKGVIAEAGEEHLRWKCVSCNAPFPPPPGSWGVVMRWCVCGLPKRSGIGGGSCRWRISSGFGRKLPPATSRGDLATTLTLSVPLGSPPLGTFQPRVAAARPWPQTRAAVATLDG